MSKRGSRQHGGGPRKPAVDIRKTLTRAFQCHERGRLPEARRLYGEVLKRAPQQFDALHLLGMLEAQDGQLEEAAKLFARALAVDANSAFVSANHALVLSMLGRHAEALASFDRALALDPRDAQAHNNRGNALRELGRHADALASYETALTIDPNSAEAQYNRGIALHHLDRLEDALASYDRALALQPDFADAHNNRGYVASRLKRHGEALASFDRALALNPRMAKALSNKAVVLDEQGEREQALASCRAALALAPDYLEARWQLAMYTIPVLAETTEEIAGSRREFARELEELSAWVENRTDAYRVVGEMQPFCLAYHEENNRDLLGRHGSLCVRLSRRWYERQSFPRPERARTGVVRLGIVSAHVRDHSVWNALIKGWVEKLDQGIVEAHLFHTGADRDDETAWAASHAASFEQGPKSLSGWVEAILARNIDALAYPEIGMDPMTLKLASMRLAGVQMAAWGHPETTGLPTIDYYLSAEAFEPPNAQDHYTERLVTLPRLGCCFRPAPVTDGSFDWAEFGIAPGAPVLLCPGMPFKYTPRHDELLVGIARRLGACRFVFFIPAEWPDLAAKLRSRLAASFARGGLDFNEHGTFIPWQDKVRYFALMKQSDLLLDTIGFSGFNTAMQAIECGLPIVTLEGRFLRGRLASGILRTMGLAELIASDEADYIELAVRLASDRLWRDEISRRIEAARPILFDDTTPVRALENLLRSCAQVDPRRSE